MAKNVLARGLIFRHRHKKSHTHIIIFSSRSDVQNGYWCCFFQNFHLPFVSACDKFNFIAHLNQIIFESHLKEKKTKQKTAGVKATKDNSKHRLC